MNANKSRIYILIAAALIIAVGFAVDEEGERIVGRRDAGVLHVGPDESVDERGLAGGVVAGEEHHGRPAGRDRFPAEGVAEPLRRPGMPVVQSAHERFAPLRAIRSVLFVSHVRYYTTLQPRLATGMRPKRFLFRREMRLRRRRQVG